MVCLINHRIAYLAKTKLPFPVVCLGKSHLFLIKTAKSKLRATCSAIRLRKNRLLLYLIYQLAKLAAHKTEKFLSSI